MGSETVRILLNIGRDFGNSEKKKYNNLKQFSSNPCLPLEATIIVMEKSVQEINKFGKVKENPSNK